MLLGCTIVTILIRGRAPTWEVRRGCEEVALSVVPAAAGDAVAAVALRQRRRRRRGREVGQVEGDRLAWLMKDGHSFFRPTYWSGLKMLPRFGEFFPLPQCGHYTG